MKRLLPLLLLFFYGNAYTQDLTQIGKAKLFTLNGGVAANAVFYDGTASREPFTYVLSGNINANISGLFNVPVSFTYSNQEFSYSQPFRFNRLSIHPSYKWVTAHIGDVAMTFSPYTLSGHQFSGLGVDLTPNGPFKVSAMYGRLIRPVEYDSNEPETEPAYKRIGYGLKASYQFDKARVGLTFFSARDEVNSLDQPIPIDVGVSPQENLVVSLEGSLQLFDRGTLNVEYATSAVTEDLNAEEAGSSVGLLSFLFDERISTSYYDAFNADITYSVGNGSLGVGYERIDPNYNTFGAYFFNNDLENITVNASQTIFNDKLNISVNGGLQRDNLDNTKTSELKRVVAAVNMNYTASERLNISGSYSNFQSFTNIQNQFDFINQVTDFDNIDTLNFKQLSQNANLSIGYIISKQKKNQQNLNINLSFQDTQDLQEQIFTGAENTVNSSQFYNGATAYTISFPEKTLSVSAAFNATLNKVMDDNTVTLGPTLVVNKQFFDKRVRSSLSSSYNTTSNDGERQNSILNFRLNAGYQLFEKHQFNMSLLALFRDAQTTSNNDFTATIGYNYSFTTANRKKQKGRKQIPTTGADGLTQLKFRYRKQIYEGNADEIVSQIQSTRNKSTYRNMPAFKVASLDKLKNDVLLLKSEDQKVLEDKVIDYLDAVYSYVDFKDNYNEYMFNSAMSLKDEAKRLDPDIEKKFIDLRYQVENHKFKGQDPKDLDSSDSDFVAYKDMHDNFIEARRKFVGHRWMLEQLEGINTAKQFDKDEVLKNFKEKHLEEALSVYDESGELSALDQYLISELFLYYQDLAKDKTDQSTYILKYIQKSE